MRHLYLVDERVHEHHEVERLEAEAVKASAKPAPLVDHMRHNSMHLRTIMGVGEVEAIGFGDFPRRVLWLVGRGSQERPVHPIEAVRSTVVAECLTAISLRVRRYRDELNLALHRRDVDHR